MTPNAPSSAELQQQIQWLQQEVQHLKQDLVHTDSFMQTTLNIASDTLATDSMMMTALSVFIGLVAIGMAFWMKKDRQAMQEDFMREFGSNTALQDEIIKRITADKHYWEKLFNQVIHSQDTTEDDDFDIQTRLAAQKPLPMHE